MAQVDRLEKNLNFCEINEVVRAFNHLIITLCKIVPASKIEKYGMVCDYIIFKSYKL